MDRRAITAVRSAFRDAIRRGDASGAASVYGEGARLIAPSAARIEGRDAIEAFWRAGMGVGLATVDIEAAETRADRPMACELGRYEIRLEPGGGPTVVEKGSYVLVLEAIADGSWRRAVEVFSPDGPAVPSSGTTHDWIPERSTR